jgi:uncharacterized metal-binding protein YceD (DUF177 family)
LPPWAKPLDVDRLADGAAAIDFAIPIGELPGLRSGHAPVAGDVSGHVHFAREQGLAVADLELTGTATIECQRCMKPMQRVLAVRSRIALIASEADAPHVPAALEAVLAEGGHISIGELVTEELLLTLPIVPLHEGADACAAAADAQAHEPPGGETHRPFARLAELLKR